MKLTIEITTPRQPSLTYNDLAREIATALTLGSGQLRPEFGDGNLSHRDDCLVVWSITRQ